LVNYLTKTLSSHCNVSKLNATNRPLANERSDSLHDAPRIRDDLTDSADLAEYAGAILNAREQSKIRESPPQKLLPVQQRGLCSSRSPIFRFAIGFRAEEVFLGERQMRIYRP
jgi:hypothetical protein